MNGASRLAGANLLPAAYRQRRGARRLMRAWAAAGAVTAAVAVAGGTAALGVGLADTSPLQAKLEMAAERVETVKKDVAVREAELKRVQREVALARTVGKHPNWATLLRILDGARDEDVVLDAVSVKPEMGSAARGRGKDVGKPARPGHYVVRVRALTRDLASATGYAGRLSAGGLLQNVRLIETKPRVEQGANLLEFALEGQLAPPAAEGESGKAGTAEPAGTERGA